MKKLFLVRHAKSDWSIDDQRDIDRSLNPRGYKDAHAIGEYIKSNYGAPQLMVASPAVRTMTTALIFSDEVGYDKTKIKVVQSLYESTSVDYLNCIKATPNEIDSLMIIGHNPVLSDLCMGFTRTIIDLPTCALVVFEFQIDEWENISKENCKLIEVKSPKS